MTRAVAVQQKAAGRLIAWSIGLAPLAMLILSWSEPLSDAQRAIRSHALPVLAVELAVILIGLIEGLRLPRPPRWVAFALAAFAAIAWGTAITAMDQVAAILHTAIWTIHLGFALSLSNLVQRGIVLPSALLDAIVRGFLLFLGAIVLYVLTHYSADRDWVHRIPAYNNIRWFGYYAAAIVGLCAWGWIVGRRDHFLIAALALAAALWTGSRGTAFAVIGAGMSALTFFAFVRAGTRRFLLLLALGFAAAALTASLLPLGTNGPQRLLNDDIDGGRVALWIISADAIVQRPWFGWGEAQFNLLIQPQRLAQPHNILFQTLLAWGFIGSALLGAIMLWLARKSRLAADGSHAPFLLGAMTIAAFSLIDGSLFHVQSGGLFFLCLAMLLTPAAENGDSGRAV